MSEPQTNQEKSAPIQTPVHSQPLANAELHANTDLHANTELKGNVKILKDAFPDLEVDLIETILDSQGDNLDASFEILLGMSDPSYKPDPSNEQMREDEAYARRLARESQARETPVTQQRPEEQSPLFNIQEELPIIKDKVIEAGTAAKNKIMDLYNQFMAPTNESQQQSNSNRHNNDLLETRMGGLNLREESERRSENYVPDNLYEWDGRATKNNTLESKVNTSTSQDQLLSDEEFARKLAREEAELATAAAIDTRPLNTNIQHSPQINEEEVTFTAVDSKENEKPSTGYNIREDDGSDDLDDIFEKKTDKEYKKT